MRNQATRKPPARSPTARNQRWTQNSVVAAVAVMTMAWAGPARSGDDVPFNPNGRYEGKLTCKFQEDDGTKAKFVVKESVLHVVHLVISETEGLLRVVDQGGARFEGRAIFDAKKSATKAVGHLTECGSTDFHAGSFELDPITIAVCDRRKDPECTKGKIKQKGFFRQGARVGTCNGSWKRVDIATPIVPICVDLF